jgi:death-on-curing protein
MKQFTLYPSLKEALFLHSKLIERFGGTGEVRDMGLLESALARPKSGYYKTIFDQAAALMQSLACNQCFADGNIRVSFAMTAIFLRINGYHLKVDADTAEKFLIVRVIQARCDIKEISDGLRKYSKKI